MFNVYDKIKSDPGFYRQLHCGDSLITMFKCQLTDKYQDAWSDYNYFVYVVAGREVIHTVDGSYTLQKGDCVFVRKGACIVEPLFETENCFIFFFMPDAFICETLQHKPMQDAAANKKADPVIRVNENALVDVFFLSMMSLFTNQREPDQALLELKFKELVLTLADDGANSELRHYFRILLHQPRAVALQQVMEENFCFNLKLEEFARLSARSLSAFKRDFEDLYQTSPGKWLLEKRLGHALHLLSYKGKTVGETAFECGFENASHFSRVFRQRFGASPAAIKQQQFALT